MSKRGHWIYDPRYGYSFLRLSGKEQAIRVATVKSLYGIQSLVGIFTREQLADIMECSIHVIDSYIYGKHEQKGETKYNSKYKEKYKCK